MNSNLSFAGASVHDAFRFVAEESPSWHENYEAAHSAQDDPGAWTPFQLYMSPLIGTEIGEPIGGVENDRSDTITFIEADLALVDADAFGRGAGDTDDALQPPEPAYEGPEPSVEPSPPPPNHIESSNAWHLL